MINKTMRVQVYSSASSVLSLVVREYWGAPLENSMPSQHLLVSFFPHRSKTVTNVWWDLSFS